jgi:hypothetical protein
MTKLQAGRPLFDSRQKNFFSSRRPNRLWGPTQLSIYWVQEFDPRQQSSSEVKLTTDVYIKNARNYTFTSPYVCTTWRSFRLSTWGQHRWCNGRRGKQQSLPIWGTTSAFDWNVWGKLWKPYVRIRDNITDNQKLDLLSMNQECWSARLVSIDCQVFFSCRLHTWNPSGRYLMNCDCVGRDSGHVVHSTSYSTDAAFVLNDWVTQ